MQINKLQETVKKPHLRTCRHNNIKKFCQIISVIKNGAVADFMTNRDNDSRQVQHL